MSRGLFWGWCLLSAMISSSVSFAQMEGESFFFTPPGFERPGKPVTARGDAMGSLRIVVRDAATNQPTPCRINVVGPDGNFYQPASSHLSPFDITGEWPKEGAWGNRPGKAPYRYLGRFFYSTGEVAVAVPAGMARVEVWKGFEFRPRIASVSVTRGMKTDVAVTLERTVPMAVHGYFGGDPHLHFARRSDRDDETILDLLEAEDVWFGTPLGYNEPAGPYTGAMDKMDSPQLRQLGRESIRARGQVSMLSGQEYRSSHFGHLNLYLLSRLVFEGKSFNLDDGPAYGVVAAGALADGGFAIHAHGGYAKEIYADAALGAVSAVELLQFGIYRELGLTGWYDMLNAGYRFPCVGASDFPACRFMSDCRTYVRPQAPSTTDPAVANLPSFPEWLGGLAEGRSFVTTGPLLLLDVDGHAPGDVVRHDGSQGPPVPIRIRVRSEVTPVTTIDLIVNGEVIKQVQIPRDKGQGEWLELRHELTPRASCWIAARAWSTTVGGQPDADAHTNPVYLELAGKRPYRQASLDAWVEKIDGQIALHTQRTFQDKANVLAYFQRARDTLLKVRERGGLKSDEDPWKLAGGAQANTAVSAAKQADITDEELREFLKPVPAKSPEEALRTFEVASGFHLELVAAEPLVRDPVAAAFDEDGQLYVCEMRDYPFKPTEGIDPIGSVRLLRDTDEDGRFDEGHLFADKLLWAAGVVPWRGGVFVAAPPDIWYLKDTDGDHQADLRRRVFTGFGTGNQQAMVNNLQWGFDQWIYGTTAGNGGTVTRVANEQALPVAITGRDFRFDPVTERFEAITGTVQFGNTFDDWGNRFTCSESQPLQHVVQPDHYLGRNPFLASPSGVLNIAPGPVPIFRISPVERWRQIRSLRRIAKNERPATAAGASHHVIDAAAGVTVYRGGAYPPEYRGQVFVGDGQNNLVHRRTLIPDGVTFQSRRADDKTEFVRSSDIWFRPVNFVNAPDGTLYCLDMCREVLESIHIPLDVAKHLDFASGRDHGRVYRIAPNAFRSPAPPRLSQATTAQLVAHLESPHGWWRDTAQRLLAERNDSAVSPALRKLLHESSVPQAKLHALWTLNHLQSLDDDTLLHALSSDHPRVREHAVRLSELRLNVNSRVVEAVMHLAQDTDSRVRYQVAFSLGETSDSRAAAVLAEMARREGGDRWMRVAILSSCSPFASRLFVDLAQRTPAADPAFLQSLANLVGLRNRAEETSAALTTLAANTRTSDASIIDPLLVELGRGLKRSSGTLRADGTAANWVQSQLSQAKLIATNPKIDLKRRVTAIELLGCVVSRDSRDTLLEMISPENPEGVQIAAIAACGNDPDPSVAAALVARWKALTPEVRRAALESLLSREERIRALLEAAASAQLSLTDMEPVRREALRNHRNGSIRQLAEQVFGNHPSRSRSRSRQDVVQGYQAALQLTGRLADGQTVFEKQCAGCHQLSGAGHAIGPNLASSPAREPQALLSHILDPNQYVLPNYVQYVLLDKQGRTYTGLVAAQTATSITLKKDRDATVTILRSEIEELVSSGKSLMPEEMEQAIPLQSMADLLTFLQAAVAKGSAESTAVRDFGTLPGLIEPSRKMP